MSRPAYFLTTTQTIKVLIRSNFLVAPVLLLLLMLLPISALAAPAARSPLLMATGVPATGDLFQPAQANWQTQQMWRQQQQLQMQRQRQQDQMRRQQEQARRQQEQMRRQQEQARQQQEMLRRQQQQRQRAQEQTRRQLDQQRQGRLRRERIAERQRLTTFMMARSIAASRSPFQAPRLGSLAVNDNRSANTVRKLAAARTANDNPPPPRMMMGSPPGSGGGIGRRPRLASDMRVMAQGRGFLILSRGGRAMPGASGSNPTQRLLFTSAAQKAVSHLNLRLRQNQRSARNQGANRRRFEGNIKAAKSEGAAQKDTTVLGSYPRYVFAAAASSHRVFHIPPAIWEKMSRRQQWRANVKFLDRTISRGDNVYLATPYDKVRPNSFFHRELRYLERKGYRPSADGRWMVRKE